MPPPTSRSLDPYTGAFGEAEAWHLLRRATFAPTAAHVAEAVSDGLTSTLDRLLTPELGYGPPLVHDLEAADPNAAYGRTWVRSPYDRDTDFFPYRYESLAGWILEGFYRTDRSLERRMWFFWMNHFGVAVEGDQRSSYRYYERLRTGALGNFRDLVKQIAVEPQMLTFLNGADNEAESPNENFARELLELFTLGKGEQVAPGDYSTYTESDVRAFARALTGYINVNQFSSDPAAQPFARYEGARHDTESKQLSSRFGGAVIRQQGAQEMATAIDLVFAQPSAGEYLSKKLYRYFVHYELNDAAESAVIAPLAQVLRESGFELKPVLRRLLGSEAFFDAESRGALIKSPLDFTVGLFRAFGFELPGEVATRYRLMSRVQWLLYDQRMLPYEPPNVAGWKAYYQAPLYNRAWITASGLQSRAGTVWDFVENGLSWDGEELFVPDFLAYIAALPNPSDPNDLVAALATRLLPMPITPEQLTALKAILVPGLPDFEWTIQYEAHRDQPDDQGLRMSVERKIRNLLLILLGSSEYNLY